MAVVKEAAKAAGTVRVMVAVAAMEVAVVAQAAVLVVAVDVEGNERPYNRACSRG